MKPKNLRVGSGSLKGKSIPIPPDVKKNSNFTPALFKKSFFSILDSMELRGEFRKENAIFYDLFAGSGQMGFEAISRGFKKSVLCEIDRGRFSTLKKSAQNFGDKISLLHRDAFRWSRNDIEVNPGYLVFFLDPPYPYWNTAAKKIHSLLDEIASVQSKKIVMIQSPVDPGIPNFEARKYGNNFLLLNSPVE